MNASVLLLPSGSLEANALSNGPNSLHQAVKEYLSLPSTLLLGMGIGSPMSGASLTCTVYPRAPSPPDIGCRGRRMWPKPSDNFYKENKMLCLFK